MILVVIIAAPLLAAALTVPAQRVAARAPSALAVGAGMVTLAAALPALGLEWALRLDGLSLLMVLLVAGMGLLVSLYARYDLTAEAPRARFFILMLLFQAAMLGLVTADNLSPRRSKPVSRCVLIRCCCQSCCFMAAGIIDHETGSRDLRRLRGLFEYLPVTGALAMIAAAAMAGVPLLNGFLSKEMCSTSAS